MQFLGACGRSIPTAGINVHFGSQSILSLCHHNFPHRYIGCHSSNLRNADGSDTIYGFQVNERYLDWDESAARQLIKIYCAEQLNTDVDFINARLSELEAVLPDMVQKLDRLKADIVLSLVKNVEAVAKRLLALAEALPGVNISEMVSGNLWLLNEPSSQTVAEQLMTLK